MSNNIDTSTLYKTYESLAEEIVIRQQYKEYAEGELNELAKGFEHQFQMINQRLLWAKFKDLKKKNE